MPHVRGEIQQCGHGPRPDGGGDPASSPESCGRGAPALGYGAPVQTSGSARLITLFLFFASSLRTALRAAMGMTQKNSMPTLPAAQARYGLPGTHSGLSPEQRRGPVVACGAERGCPLDVHPKPHSPWALPPGTVFTGRQLHGLA